DYICLNNMISTPNYKAPEIITLRNNSTFEDCIKIDIWSLGITFCVLYFCCTMTFNNQHINDALLVNLTDNDIEKSVLEMGKVFIFWKTKRLNNKEEIDKETIACNQFCNFILKMLKKNPNDRNDLSNLILEFEYIKNEIVSNN